MTCQKYYERVHRECFLGDYIPVYLANEPRESERLM
jgi:hypothetical protein